VLQHCCFGDRKGLIKICATYTQMISLRTHCGRNRGKLINTVSSAKY